MLQNLKVDIVYYRTNTDFELEFNLCGCCRMRLLTDKAPDRKTLVHDLARAVSRSRVIIISGNLFGEDGIMDITARAISKTLTEIDNKRICDEIFENDAVLYCPHGRPVLVEFSKQKIEKMFGRL